MSLKVIILGIFDKIKGQTSDKTTEVSQVSPEFKSIIIDTNNVLKEIKNVATANRLNSSDLAFKLLKIITYYSDEKSENHEMTQEEMSLLLDDSFLLNPNLKITQTYRVEIYKIGQEETPMAHLPEITLSGNKNLTKIIATVAQSHDVTYSSDLEQRMIDDIQIKKIKTGILVGIRDHNMYQEVKKLVAMIHVNGFLDKNHSFIVCAGVDEIAPINDNLVFHYKKKMNAKSSDGKVDYSKRGFILAVEKDECILEYIKPQAGTPGRNCRGVFIAVPEPRVSHTEVITTTEHITKKESETSIKYIANRGGYVNIDKGTYDIQEHMEINEISFKSTGSIDASLDSNIKINIKETDILKDAIGAGMSVETAEVHVQGNVGSGARVKAKVVEIGGQTHQSSYIEADKIKVTVHHGEANGQDVEIERLEGGKVIADTVYVKHMTGGEIIAKVIKIDNLMSNAKITASEKIEIAEFKGSNNKLIIDPSVTKEFNEMIASINKKIEVLEEELKAFPRQLTSKKEFIDKNKPMAEMVKEKIMELKRNNVEPPITLFAKVKDFQEKVMDYNAFLQIFKDKKEELREYKEELNGVQNKVFLAKIINHSTWKEFNEVRFKLIYPPRDMTYNPKENEIIREISLKDMGTGEYRIIRASEYSRS
ncbi:putative polymerase with PALM domain, HD hydrolase domain and Zn ribbon [Sulfurospirillum barnesii SES-3]|uniref:Putative polymerase with PALM domain, HD hydrolase domain and Zn ribbon n=1 Tax=Sulfurospirillum barnesii (strain ATCC 700032 / DSM 10660 / SES-3) TaxID=760154 RepID=I3XX32_SULBS|nr:putative polymerase with PALM domain, HD hydrolase domain and Zn ribbon [Sulfurospirillum barnesii SES-3]